MRQAWTSVAVVALAVTFGAVALAQGAAGARSATRPDGTRIFGLNPISVINDGQPLSLAEVNAGKLYYTRDRCATWEVYDGAMKKWPDGKDGFTFKAPSDGHYGFSIDYKGKPPVAGERPGNIKWAVIDTTPPAVQPKSPPENSRQPVGQPVPITWESQDDNPGTNSARLFYSADDGNSWSSIAAGLPTSGTHMWAPSEPNNTTVKIGIDVYDAVSNVSRVVIQNIVVNFKEEQVVRRDRPELIIAPKGDKIYFEYEPFDYSVANLTGSPLALVRVWYSMDGGKIWQCGGTNTTGSANGTVMCYFAPGFRRHGAFGNYNHISFYYQAIVEDGRASADDPENGQSQGMISYYVDTDPPKFALENPTLAEKLYKGEIPNNPNSGKYEIRWNGADKNALPFVIDRGFERGPVSIYYVSNPRNRDSKRVLLADRLPLNGTYMKWNDLPAGRCEIIVRATDQMGNFVERRSNEFEVIDGNPWTPADYGQGEVEIDRLWSEANQLYAAGNFAEAIKLYDRCALLAPSDRLSAVKHDKAFAMYHAGNTSEALDVLSGIVAAEPGNLTFRYSLASFYDKQNRTADAKAQLEAIVERDDATPHISARAMLAQYENTAGNSARAKELWQFIKDHGSPASPEYKRADWHLTQLKRAEQR